MKKLFLSIIVLGLLLSGNAYAIKDKDFYISCSAKGYSKFGLIAGSKEAKTIIDEYKITIGKGDVLQGDRWPKIIQLVNTNADQKKVMIFREPFDKTISYSDKILSIGTVSSNEEIEFYQQAQISLISGTYTIKYKDKFLDNEKDTSEYSGTGKCSGLVPVLSYLENGSTNSTSSSGTAFFISNKGYLLTNNHVVKGCSLSKITYFNKEYDAKLIATDKTLDLALLKVKIKPKSYFSFSKDEPKKLQKIYVAGYPLGKGLSDDLKITTGIISALKGFEDNSNEIQVDAAINPGNSGGPIVNENGELVAIAVSGITKAQNINFGIKSSAAANFLKLNSVKPSKSLMSFSSDTDELLEILEEATVYTFCN